MKLFKDYAVLAGGQVVGKVLGFLAFAWLARALDPRGYAAVEYVVGLGFLFGAVVEGGFGVVGVRRAARRAEALPVLAFQIPWVRLVLALASMPVMVAVAVYGSRAAVPWSLAVLFALALLTVPWRQEWLLQAQERMAQAALMQLVKALVFALVVIVAIRGPDDVARAGIAELASALAMSAYCIYVQQTRITPVRLHGSFGGARALVAEGAVVALGTIVFTLHQYTPLFLSAPMAGAVPTAWYAAASRITLSLLVFSYLYHYSLYPAVARATQRRDASLARLFRASCRTTAWTGTLAALALTLVAERAVVISFGEKMAAAAPVLAVLAWSLPVVLCSGHARWGLVACGAQGDVLRAQIAGLVVTVLLCLVLGSIGDETGFAAAALGGFVAVWIVSHRRAALRGTMPPSPLLMLAPAALALAAFTLVELAGVHGWARLAGALAFVVLAPIVDRRIVPDLRTLAAAKATV